MKNVTISMDEALLQQVRVSAATQGKSVSRYVGELLSEELILRPARVVSVSAALDALLAMPDLNIANEAGKMPTREELYDERDDELLRRRERAALHDGPARPGKTGARRGVAG